MIGVVRQQVGYVETDLDVLRNENAVLESERDPEFKRRVETETERARREIERLGRVVA